MNAIMIIYMYPKLRAVFLYQNQTIQKGSQEIGYAYENLHDGGYIPVVVLADSTTLGLLNFDDPEVRNKIKLKACITS